MKGTIIGIVAAAGAIVGLGLLWHEQANREAQLQAQLVGMNRRLENLAANRATPAPVTVSVDTDRLRQAWKEDLDRAADATQHSGAKPPGVKDAAANEGADEDPRTAEALVSTQKLIDESIAAGTWDTSHAPGIRRNFAVLPPPTRCSHPSLVRRHQCGSGSCGWRGAADLNDGAQHLHPAEHLVRLQLPAVSRRVASRGVRRCKEPRVSGFSQFLSPLRGAAGETIPRR